MTLSVPYEEKTTVPLKVWHFRWYDALIMVLLAAVTFVTRFTNLWEYPGVNIDEGFYVSQSWSVLTRGELSPTGYWFDHLPGGWILQAGYFGLTGALGRHADFLVFAGREFVLVLALFVAPLLYWLARRLEVRRSFAVVAALLWVVSPLAIMMSRMALLDNIAVPWVLASMALVLSPQRRWVPTLISGLCFAAAYLTKEIMLLVLAGLAYTAFQHFRGSGRMLKLSGTWLAGVVLGLALVPVVSLLTGQFNAYWRGQVDYQLNGRQSKGSIFDPSSPAHEIVFTQWLHNDWWLPLLGVAAVLPALFIARLRGPAIIVGLHAVVILLPFRFLPTAFVVIMLPFMALLVAGVLDAIWPERSKLRGTKRQRVLSVAGLVAVAGLFLGFSFAGGFGSWLGIYGYQFTAQENTYQRQAINWVHQNLREDDVVVTEYHLWLDVLSQGLDQKNVANPYQFEHEWDDAKRGTVTYLVLNAYSLPGKASPDSPLTQLAQRSQPVEVFGQSGDYRQMVILRLPPAKT